MFILLKYEINIILKKNTKLNNIIPHLRIHQ
jgi:hypothetical protein